ncbi:MAG: UvrB/UvrC motif-containing protein [Planctomycetota bacterium]
MAKRPKHLDRYLKDWPYEFGEVTARLVEGEDGREVIQLRIDMGILQMEVTGRPDGWEPEGFDTYYDLLRSVSFDEDEAFELDGDRCMEVDREFVQFYHRRIAWLSLREFRRAVLDADHTLGLMDFSSAHAPDEEWADLHEQYRPFVLFHRTQASALAEIDDMNPQGAVDAIDEGLRRLREVFERQDLADEFDDDDLVTKLLELKEALSDHYEIEPPLSDQLAEAIASEQYERAAEIRDRLARRPRRKM